MSDFNVSDINEKQRTKLSETIREIQLRLPVILAGQHALAQVTRARYLSLIEQGFTPAQALELSK